MTGEVLHIHIASAASMEMEELDEATLMAGKGIEGDRYFLGNGTYWSDGIGLDSASIGAGSRVREEGDLGSTRTFGR